MFEHHITGRWLEIGLPLRWIAPDLGRSV